MRILYMDCFLGFDATMLLGALVDAGASAEAIETKLKEDGINLLLSVKTTTRSSINCKRVLALANTRDDIDKAMENEFVSSIINTHGSCDGTDALSVTAVLCAAELLDIEYIITSDVSLGEKTDGRVIAILDNAAIHTMPSDGSTKNMQPADAAFLAAIANECGPKPPMTILSIGYGAGGTNCEEPNIISAIIGEFESGNMFDMAEQEELISAL